MKIMHDFNSFADNFISIVSDFDFIPPSSVANLRINRTKRTSWKTEVIDGIYRFGESIAKQISFLWTFFFSFVFDDAVDWH